MKYVHLSRSLDLRVGATLNVDWRESSYFASKLRDPNDHFPASDLSDFEACKISLMAEWTGELLQEIPTDRQVCFRLKNESISKTLQQTDAGLKSLFLGKPKQELLKEFIFEHVRTNMNKELPSRLSCAYLIREDKSADWIHTFFAGTGMHNKFRLSVVKATVFDADACWLDCNSASIEEMCERAAHYWSGIECDEETPKCETLAVGEFRVEQIEQVILEVGP